ncbi:AraC family transcriptional regulator [Tengunoibacter tsumagoiensis]|uniref:HTH-type transcriptional activator RhaR n=1 Tax=Tengunoibacter tsumagoiensis TaxID=2014871 RepID=A0A402AAA7_9CHLR|nr:AraC family transcriptional regulator [Tengunoibacter tsumagoiensis]GCE16104.1 HTH-type transcriptional activator RhaR [Tengunoibacter tsumagoiensis]
MKLIFGANTLQYPAGWQFAEHQHAGIEVVGILTGQVLLMTPTTRMTVKAGQVVCIAPYIPHCWASDHAGTLNVLHFIHAPRDLTQRLVSINRPRLISLSSTQFAEYNALFSRLAALEEQAPLQQVRLLRAYVEAFLLTLLESDQVTNPNHALVYEIATYMQVHIHESFTIAQIAHQFALSEATLRRRFHELFHTSPKQYLIDLRLNEAQYLLATTQLAVKEIAIQLGFFDLAHFSSLFHQRVGHTPSQWREKAAHL